jgi:hypothetical protein
MELGVIEGGRDLLRGVIQHGLDAQAAAEVRLAGVTGADGVTRTLAERGHSRAVVTTAGEVRVARIGYRVRAKGVPALFPRDAVLNLPPRGYSWQLQRLAVMFARDGSYELARELVLAVTGAGAGTRRLEEMAAAAADVAAFYCPAGPEGQPELGTAGPVALPADGKGVAVRPESRRERTVAPQGRVKNFASRAGTGGERLQADCRDRVRVRGDPRAADPGAGHGRPSRREPEARGGGQARPQGRQPPLRRGHRRGPVRGDQLALR